MSPTVAFVLALLASHAGLKLNLQIKKDDVKRMLEREEYLHQEMTRLLQEVDNNKSIMESLLCSAQQLLWLPWLTKAGQKGNPETEKSEAERMQEREEYLFQEITRLLQEIDDNKSIMETLLCSAQQLLWLPWLTEAVLLSLAFWLVMRWKRGSASRRRQEGSSSQKQGLPSTKVLQELVDELLGVCRVLSRRSFMPELHPAARTDTSPAACSVQESSSSYRTLVILRPPPGHSFSPESTKRPPARRIRVALECLCSGEQLLGHTCFLHAAGGQLPTDQEWYLLDTLCTGSYLDLQKVTRWVQMLVLSAWPLLPQSRHCQLTALPSGKSCSFQLSGASGLHCSIEMALAVHLSSSGTRLSLELPSSKSCSFRLSGASGLHCSIEMALAVQLGSSGACLSLE
ncbi:uncharacterized protein LOC120503669 [Passer montanus]|uniref:uncharacterized protein LOC120503669 n=1 Tax=Passer montanus TaxID=9160 RepID=UPI0019605591|nr:uncharacterized protein LOC120503669 [Passer montanus]